MGDGDGDIENDDDGDPELEPDGVTEEEVIINRVRRRRQPRVRSCR